MKVDAWGLVVALPDGGEQLLEGRFPTQEAASLEGVNFTKQAAEVLRIKEEDAEIKPSRPDPISRVIYIGSGMTGKSYMTVRPVLVEPYLRAKR